MYRNLMSFISAFIVSVTPSMAEAIGYTFTIVDSPVPGIIAEPTGINTSGQIVGTYGPPGAHGFTKNGSSYTTFDFPGATGTFSFGINDFGQIVGIPNDAGNQQSFLKDGNSFTIIEIPMAISTQAYGINNSGQIVGTTAGINGFGAFVKDGSNYTIFDVPVGVNPTPRDINNKGQIVGFVRDPNNFNFINFRAFLKDGNTFTTFDVPGASYTEAYGINDLGQIAGFFSYDGRGNHGFVKDGDTFTVIDVPGAFSTNVYGINNLGQVVGVFQNSAGFSGFLATPSSVDEPHIVSYLATMIIGLIFVARKLCWSSRTSKIPPAIQFH